MAKDTDENPEVGKTETEQENDDKPKQEGEQTEAETKPEEQTKETEKEAGADEPANEQNDSAEPADNEPAATEEGSG